MGNKLPILPRFDSGTSVTDGGIWRVLLEGEATFVWRLQFVGFADPLAVYHDHRLRPIVEDLKKEPLLIGCDGPARRGYAV